MSSSSRDAMRFTTLVPALEEQLAKARPDGLVGLGTVAELQEQLARILQVAESLNQPDRIERIKALQQGLLDIEAQAVLQYGAEAQDPSMEMVVSMRVPSSQQSSSTSKPHSSEPPSRAAIAGALALTVCTAGLAAPWYISLRRKRTASKAPVQPPTPPTSATTITTPSSSAAAAVVPSATPPAEDLPPTAVAKEAEPQIDCPVCFDTVAQSDSCGLLNCTHRSCRACFVEYFSVKIRDGQVSDTDLVCPDPSCTVAAQAYELESILPEETFTKYSDFLVLRGLENDADTCWCPNLQCGEAIVAPRNQNDISCPACSQSFCKLCKISPWHGGQSCEEAKKATEAPEEDGLVIWMREQGTKVKLCPGCKEAIEKNSGCNHMTCSRCSHQFCWLCGQSFQSDHFSNGPCSGLQFAAGDSLEEALSLRDRPVDSPLRISPPRRCRIRRPISPIPVPEIFDNIDCGLRPPSPFDIEPLMNIQCGMRPPSPIPEIDIGPDIQCGMRPIEFIDTSSLDENIEQVDCEMSPPPSRIRLSPRSILPAPTIACGMRHPDSYLPSPTLPTILVQPDIISAPVGVPSHIPPAPAPPESTKVNRPKPNKSAESSLKKLLIRRCGKRAPKPKIAPATSSSTSSPSSSSPRPWTLPERQRIFDTCKMMLEMLETIEDSFSALFHNRQFLHAAWNRFVQWIQLLHTHRDVADRLLPPLDVAFVWHAYMIRTEIYIADLPALLNGADPDGLGMNVAWKCATSAASEADREFSVRTWQETITGSPYHGWNDFAPDASAADSSSDLPYQLRMSFLLEDMKWIQDLRRGWPRFTSNRCDFLNDTMEAYFDWVQRTYSAETLPSLKGPAVDVDAFWHSHMLNPSAYKADVEARYGPGCTIWHRPLADGVHDPATL